MENKFYKELSKFKKAEKVELAVIDDFKKLINEAKGMDNLVSKNVVNLRNDYLDVRSRIMKIDKTYKNVSLDVEDMKDLVSRIEKTVSKLATSAKELGIDPKSIDGTTEIVRIVESLEDDIDTFEKQENDYKRIIQAI
jgi:predicted  nucleic acid-binding Zn-ribbon protein